MAERQAFMIQSEQVQDGGVKIGGLGAIDNRAVSEIVSGSVSLAALDASTGQPNAEAIRMVIASFAAGLVAVALLGGGCATKLTAPLYQRSIE